jgi:hypothetical protein
MIQAVLQCNASPHKHVMIHKVKSHIYSAATLCILRCCCCCLPALNGSKLFQDDPAVKSGMLQVFVRMKPVPETTETCMQLEQNQLLKAVWYVYQLHTNRSS